MWRQYNVENIVMSIIKDFEMIQIPINIMR